MKTIKYLTAAMLATAALTAHAALQVPGPIVSASWVHKHLKDVVVLDIRFDAAGFTRAPVYNKTKGGKQVLAQVGGHIPGANLVKFADIRVIQQERGKAIIGMLPGRSHFENLMEQAGASNEEPVIITSPGTTVDDIDAGTRLYWQVRIYGGTNVAVLNGGNAAWLQAGYPVATNPPPFAMGDWTAKPKDETMLATIDQVEKMVKVGHEQFIDARPENQYFGVTWKAPYVKAGGHLPGALNLPPELLLKPVGKAMMFLKPDQYKTMFRQVGIHANVPTTTYCNTGHLASGAWFVMHEVMKDPKVRLYDGSMLEWTTLGNPVQGLPKS
jgi:Rhodanese-related sulfurtransferase